MMETIQFYCLKLHAVPFQEQQDKYQGYLVIYVSLPVL